MSIPISAALDNVLLAFVLLGVLFKAHAIWQSLLNTLWRNAPLLDTAFAQDAARGLMLAYFFNCAFNF